MSRKKPSKAGRKSKDEKEKMTSVTLRLPVEMLARIEKKAGKRSISDTIREYLKTGFKEDDRDQSLMNLFQTESAYGLAMLLGKFVGNIETTTGAAWNEERFTFEAVRAGMHVIINEMMPKEELSYPERIQETRNLYAGLINEADDPERKKGLSAIFETYSVPYTLGHSFALGCLQMLKTAPSSISPKAKEYDEYPRIRQRLESKKKG